MIREYVDTLITEPKPIDDERWAYALGVLPPCKWHTTAGGFNVFHVSERITQDLVSWYARRNGHYWEFNDRSTVADAQIDSKLARML